MDRLIASNSVPLAQADTAPTTGTPQYATDGNPATNTPATLWPAYAFNTIQDEIYNVIVGAGLTPNRNAWNQLLTAIQTMLLGGTTTYAVDTGVANAYVGAYTPAITATPDGTRLRFRAKTANTGASTFTPNSGVVTAAAILGGGHSALQGGEIIANGDVEVVWNSALAAWVLLECTGGALQVAPSANSHQAPQTAQVQGGTLTTLTSVSGTNTITSALSPAPTSMPAGARFRFQPANVNTGVTTLQINGFAAHAISKFGNALQGGELNPACFYEVVFDGTNYELQSVAIPYFMTGAANSATEVDAVPNGTGTGASFRAWGALGQTNCTYGALTLSSTDLRVDSGIVGSGSYVPLTFYAAGSEKARFDTSGNLLIGKTVNAFGTVGAIFATSTGALTVTASHGTTAMPLNVVSASGTETAMSFAYSSSVVGSIQMTASATSYLTSSDYRLKQNVVPLTGGLARLQTIPVHRFDFISNAGVTVDGFLAHEVEAAVPEAVAGQKDAARTAENVVLDAGGKLLQENIAEEAFEADRTSFPDGSTWATSVTVPVYQSIDQSKLVPLLVAAVQDLAAQVAALQAKVGA